MTDDSTLNSAKTRQKLAQSRLPFQERILQHNSANSKQKLTDTIVPIQGRS